MMEKQCYSSRNACQLVEVFPDGYFTGRPERLGTYAFYANWWCTFRLGSRDGFYQFVQPFRRHVAVKLGFDAAWIYCCRPDTAYTMAPVEFDREQDIGGLRKAVGNSLVVGRPLKVWVI